MENVTLTKAICEKYHMKLNKPECLWTEITFDDNGPFNVQSDNGNFQYRWPRHGRDSSLSTLY